MGTRGAYGIRYKNQDKISYNHFDSYIESLGVSIAEFIKDKSVDDLIKIYNNMKLVDSDGQPTKEEIEKCIELKLFDDNVSKGSVDEYYSLLRNSQGLLDIYIDNELPFMDDHDFLHDSLFCEYAYIINLDSKKLEIYQGFQKSISIDGGRYNAKSRKEDSEYVGVKLIKELDINNEIVNNINDLNKELTSQDDE